MDSKRLARVLIVVENLPVPFDRRVWTEARTLHERGHEVSIICPTGKGHEAPYEVLEGIHIYRHRLPAESGRKIDYVREYAAALWAEWRLSRRVRRERGFDVVQICNPPDLLFLVALWHRWLHGTRVIFDHHDVGPELYFDKYGRRDLFWHLLGWAERLTFATAHVVMSTNDSYRDVALRRGKKRPEDVFVVRSAPDLERFRHLPAREPADGRAVVGYVGVMAPQDGVDRLLYAANHVVHVRGRKDVRFELIGGGPSLPDLERLSTELKLDEHVIFHGFLSGDALLERLGACDVCAGPDPASPYNHMCTMNKVLEYMALGKPIVQFELEEGRTSAGAASLYADGIEDFGDKLLELIDDPEERARMGAIGLQRMRDELAWHHQAPRLLAAYDRASARLDVAKRPAVDAPPAHNQSAT